MSGEVNGADVLIQVNMADEGLTPDYQTVASQKNVVLSEALTTIDVSSKESRNEKHKTGRYSATMTLDTLFVPGGATFKRLQYCHRNGIQVRVRTMLAGEAVEQALATITALVQTATDQQAVTANATMKISDGWQAA